MLCPLCRVLPLAPERHRNVEIDRCARCHGAWFDRGEIERVLAYTIPARAPAAGGVTSSLCPRCQGPMERMRTPKGTIDTLLACAAGHGLWLDGASLQRLAALRARGGHAAQHDAAREREERVSLDESPRWELQGPHHPPDNDDLVTAVFRLFS